VDEAELIQAIDVMPEIFRERALCLELPWNALLRYYDADSLLTEIDSEIRSASRIHAGQRGREAYHDSPRLQGALELLARAGDERIDEHLNSLYHCPDLHHYLEGQLYQLMWLRAWHNSEPQMRSWVRRWTKEAFSDFHMGQALIRLSDCPEADDRDFYWWAVKHHGNPEFRYRGLVALEALGEDSPEWQLRLQELAQDPDLITRVAAAGALLRKGDPSYLDQVVSATSKTNDPCARAVALQCLGAYDAARFLPLFQKIARERVECITQHHPAAVEAAYQLACLATPEALSTLAQVCLRGSWALFRLIYDQLLPAAVSRSEGEAVSMPHPHPNWRYSQPWKWRCC
jgi:hypothetical protein